MHIKREIKTSIVLMILISASGCINPNENSEDNDIELEYWYEIEMKNLTLNDMMYFPLIMDYSGNVSEVNSEIEIINGNYSFIDTTHGEAIKIDSDERTVELQIQGNNISKTEVDKIDYPHFLYLSLYKDENLNDEFDFEDSEDYKLQYHIYYDGISKNSSFALDFGYEWSGGETYGGWERIEIKRTTLKQGWNLYNASYGEGHS